MALPSDLPSRHWLQASVSKPVPWMEAVRPASLSVLLNFGGEAELLWAAGHRIRLQSGTMLWLRPGEQLPRQSLRLPGRERHECLVLHYSDAWIGRTLQDTRTEIAADLRPLVIPPWPGPGPSGTVRPLIPQDRVWALSLMAPHLCEQARHLLDTARLTEFFLRRLFEPSGPPVEVLTRAQRVSRERIGKVKELLLQKLDNPPPLEELAVVAGCNPHYLSRTFTQEEGLPLSLWLRRARIARAAELLSSGRCNVSEAAVAVGYRSFSHFSRAFQEEKGVPPSRWVEHLGGGSE